MNIHNVCKCGKYTGYVHVYVQHNYVTVVAICELSIKLDILSPSYTQLTRVMQKRDLLTYSGAGVSSFKLL